ncbi:MAG: hypothetical protein QGI33_04930 [Candidatus Brocadiia bacterium]|jgi:hypothetical protein|nr:hypothetical protein [Candidatus Brocadiia bacterium]
MGCDRAPELYSLSDDPAQEHDVGAENPGVVAGLHAGLMELLEREGAPEESMAAARKLPGLKGGQPGAGRAADYWAPPRAPGDV